MHLHPRSCAITVPTQVESAAPTFAGRSRRALLAIPGAGALTLAIWAVAQALTTVNVRLGPVAHASVTHVEAGTVVAVTLIAGLLAWLSRQAARRYLAGGGRSWVRLALGLLAVSLLGPISSATTAAATLALCILHRAAAAVLIPMLASPRASRSSEALSR
jgi:hypothetical protein